MSEREITGLVEKLAELLLAGQQHLCTAESCTGGWISKSLTDRSGSSAWFDCGLVTYSNEAKQSLLGVTAELLEQHGAVSRAVAEAMVAGALERCGADAALAVTGIAGPDGGTADKPVGTVWFAWQLRGQVPVSHAICFAGDRDSVRHQIVAEALRGMVQLLG
ncbi:MAG: CinA family protein [Gammaproteobacteria bacterium]